MSTIGSEPGSITFLPKASTTRIDRPDETVNAFTIKKEGVAQEKLAQAGINNLSGLSAVLKDIDFTSVTTRQLREVGGWLRDSGIVDQCVVGEIMGGKLDFDNDGHQINIDEKFNAIALFNEELEGHNQLAIDYPIFAPQKGFQDCTAMLVMTNHVLSALVYFANTGRELTSIDERV